MVRRAYGVMLPAWVVALPLATYAATRVQASTLTHAFAFAVYSIGSLICHQKPDRSFHLWATQLPVCARCTGIYIGGALGLVMRWRKPASWALAVAAVPTAVTLVYEWTTGDTPSNAIRFAAGLPLGAVASWLVTRSIE